MTRSSYLGSAIVLAVLALVLYPSASLAERPSPPEPEFADPCDLGQCDCAPINIVDLAQYFVPTYPGWDTAKKIWLSANGDVGNMRFFSYAPGRYELMKFGNNTASETYVIDNAMIRLTAENNINNTNQTRTYPNYPADWMPRYACANKPKLNVYDACHGGEYYFTNCVFTNSFGPHCGIFPSRVLLYYGWNYGYNVGAVDTVIKVDKRDDGVTEKYYYGKNKGFLRWEYIEANGAMTNWGQQIDEAPNSPLVHGACFQP